MDKEFTLYQLGGDVGNIYFNSGPDPLPLITAGRQLMMQYPGTDFAVMYGNETVWSSKDKGTAVKYRLVRELGGGIGALILPGNNQELMIIVGKLRAKLYPDQVFRVIDNELQEIWTNKKSAPGQAEDTPQNG